VNSAVCNIARGAILLDHRVGTFIGRRRRQYGSDLHQAVAPEAVWRPLYQSEIWYGGTIPICYKWNLNSWFLGKSLKLLPPDVKFKG